MAGTCQLLISVLLVQICVIEISSNVINLDSIANVKEADKTQDQLSLNIDDGESTQPSKREKRWFDPYGFGLSPIFPPGFPNFERKEESSESGVYGLDDPLPHIYRKLKELNTYIKKPTFNNFPQVPLSPPVPFLFPIIYVPSNDCTCNDTEQKEQETETPPPKTSEDDVPGVDKRFPAMDDKRQNWGFVENDTIPEDDSSFDSRPLSFEPLSPPPGARPPPPVNHGSIAPEMNFTGTTTQAPAAESSPTRPPPQASSPSPDLPQSIPSSCDGAILTCCHQPQVTYECFESKGCPDPFELGNPCDVDVILKVIDRFQRFYGQRR